MAQHLKTFLPQLKKSELFIEDAFIDGQWVKAKDGKTFEVYEPATEDVLGRVANCDRDDIKRAIETADLGQKKFYKSTTAAQRGVLLRKWYDAIMENEEDLATILCLENGKTLLEARGEITYAASYVLWFSEEAPRAYGETIPSSTPNTTVLTFKQPIGTCGIITPWNFPAAMITRKIAPAIAVGCSVVVKPPSETPFTALALTKLAVDVGIPPRTIQVVPTRDRTAATELATNPIIKKLSFTGSTGVGKMLTQLAAGTMKKVSMELGGNAPFIVFADADLDLAADAAMICKFRCSGQTCVCANRILAHKSVAAEFTKKLVARVAKLQLGAGMDKSTTIGPLVNKGGVDKVAAHITDAVSKGAKIEIGGKKPAGKGFFHEPTVLSGVTPEMLVANDETFGPLAPVFTFESEEEAVRLANATEFGLAGYFFSRDVGRVLRVARALEVGMVGVNTGKISEAALPFGGVKESGLGREGSMYGLAEYQVIKSVTIGNTDL
ncbi:aldehyde dehydrogenase [Ascodesmis nigricans]|uniref:Succinate-semialdehyde dehydrogenase, mitochondrial n=1 Tax=Ascodesmis nigricans TaxID=341454 RepID=A0A4V3SJ25_9PEZI|nr:aldehyde dehydrogenase [Ascodesmis nigricans]